MRGSNKVFCNINEIENAYFPKSVERKEIKSIQDQKELGTYWAKVSLDKAKQKLEKELTRI